MPEGFSCEQCPVASPIVQEPNQAIENLNPKTPKKSFKPKK
jgi:hypothetical protein